MNFRIILFFLLGFAVFSCQEAAETADTASETAEVAHHLDGAPAGLLKVLETHGGYDLWEAQQAMTYTVVSKQEKHQIELPTRKVRLETDKYTIGFDGQDVWLQQDSAHYSGSARFYHNLYFYFIAMPFVLADPGIKYEEVAPVSFEGVDYPGIKVSYEANVGDSPDDNYILYYHPEAYVMEWLAYTVTYRSKEPSDNFRLIRYADWKSIDGLILPQQLTWYKYEEGTIVEPSRDPMLVEGMEFSTTALDAAIFAKPEDAEVAAR